MRLDLTGQRFGRLVAVEPGDVVGPWRNLTWICKCDCGNTAIVKGSLLKRGATKSCGCLNKEALLEANRTHGMTGTKIRGVWYTMVRRCTDPNVKSYPSYGGRGIRVCDKWMKFAGFYEDMGGTYQKGLTLDRKDNDGDYCKDNCQWTTPKAQANNTRANKILIVKGEELTLAQACEKYGVPYGRTKARLLSGWADEDAIFIPKRGGAGWKTSLLQTRAK